MTIILIFIHMSTLIFIFLTTYPVLSQKQSKIRIFQRFGIIKHPENIGLMNSGWLCINEYYAYFYISDSSGTITSFQYLYS